jgi:secretion/DNA translocation related TadE-like protein
VKRIDEGSASVLVCVGILLLAPVATGAAAIGAAMSLRTQAMAAADLSALAAAAGALEGEREGCRRAGRVARGNGASLISCEIRGEAAHVVVARDPPTALDWLTGTGPPTIRAEAKAVLTSDP